MVDGGTSQAQGWPVACLSLYGTGSHGQPHCPEKIWEPPACELARKGVSLLLELRGGGPAGTNLGGPRAGNGLCGWGQAA